MKAKGVSRSNSNSSPAPSRRENSKSKKTAQLTKLGGGKSGTLQLIRYEAGVVAQFTIISTVAHLPHSAPSLVTGNGQMRLR